MPRTIFAVLLVLALGMVSCASKVNVAKCDGGAPDGSVAHILSVTADLSRMTMPDAGVVSVPLVIDAEVPCLLAGLTATVTTSIGTVGGASAGMPANVLLAPTADQRFAGTLAGETTLEIPVGGSARLEVVLADDYKIETLSF